MSGPDGSATTAASTTAGLATDSSATNFWDNVTSFVSRNKKVVIYTSAAAVAVSCAGAYFYYASSLSTPPPSSSSSGRRKKRTTARTASSSDDRRSMAKEETESAPSSTGMNLRLHLPKSNNKAESTAATTAPSVDNEALQNVPDEELDAFSPQVSLTAMEFDD